MEITDKLVRQIHNTYEQLGIRPFMEQPGVTEIVINEPGVIYYEENSVWKRQTVEHRNSNELIEGLGKLLINNVGQSQKFDEHYPMLSLTMPDGERAQLVRQPAAEQCSLTVRIPSKTVRGCSSKSSRPATKSARPTRTCCGCYTKRNIGNFSRRPSITARTSLSPARPVAEKRPS